jgi:hypothetical protein
MDVVIQQFVFRKYITNHDQILPMDSYFLQEHVTAKSSMLNTTVAPRT